MRLLLLLVLTGSLRGQPSLIEFSSTLKEVVDGKTHCYFWVLPPTSPYGVEVACYDPGPGAKLVVAAVIGQPLLASFTYGTVGAAMTWMVKSDHTWSVAAGLPGQEKTFSGSW